MSETLKPEYQQLLERMVASKQLSALDAEALRRDRATVQTEDGETASGNMLTLLSFKKTSSPNDNGPLLVHTGRWGKSNGCTRSARLR